jgi:catechol 2,3-dioxygenase-like lactoylglutathione lyase family enzyme
MSEELPASEAVAPKFAHVVLQTSRIQQMREGYRAVLGAAVVFEGPGSCFWTFDDEHHRVELMASPGPPFVERTPLTVGLQHSAFTFPDLESLLGRFAWLRDQGIEALIRIQHGVSTSLYYRDPDGNCVEPQLDNFAQPADATPYMRSAEYGAAEYGAAEYGADAAGPAFDPDTMASALANGTPVAELTSRAYAIQAGRPVADPLAALLGTS